jgi:hypothetical protein
MHWHSLVKLGGVLDTAILGRMIHNGRVVRNELKCGNILPDKQVEAWNIIEAGLLANRYVTLFGDSISSTSFYSEEMSTDQNDTTKVLNIDQLRKEFVQNYKSGHIDLNSHPIMRTFADQQCDPNPLVEAAKIASASCVHSCIKEICGGDEKTGQGCRFNFPHKPVPHTVAGVFQVNSTQMECRLILRRTPGAERVPNLNIYFLLYWRSNHDCSVLIDGAHKMR